MKLTINEIKASFLGETYRYRNEEEKIDFHIAFDSRFVKQGDIFVCLPGEKTNGHHFAKEALKNGAIGIVSEYKLDLPDQYFQIIVQSSEKALQNAAKMILKKYPIEQIGITGSAGKTTTKELLYSMMSNYLTTSKTIGNFNTPIGVPVSIVNMVEAPRLFICEISASYPGEIDVNLSLLNLSYAIITSIGPSHLEFFGSVENVFFEKMKIIHAIKVGGKLIINGDQSWGQIAKKENPNNLTYGFKDQNDIQAFDVRERSDGYSFSVRIQNDIWTEFHLPVFGEHFILDSLPGIFLSMVYGLKVEEIRSAMKDFKTDLGRGKRIPFLKDSIIIDESYNANPLSFEVALHSFTKLNFPRKILVMGDMLELGPDSEKLHFDIGEEIAKTDVAIVCYLGEFSKSVRTALNNSSILFYEFSTLDEIEDFLISNLKKRDGILIKASNGIGLHQLVKKLTRIIC